MKIDRRKTHTGKIFNPRIKKVNTIKEKECI